MEGSKKTTLILEKYLNGQMGIGQMKKWQMRWSKVGCHSYQREWYLERYGDIPMHCIPLTQKVFNCDYEWSSKEGSPRWIQRQAKAGYECLAKSLQTCLTRCDPIEGSLPGSLVPGSLQARTLEWVAISFSNAGKWKVKVKSLSRVRLLATPWTAAYQAPPSWDFPGKSTGVGCHCLLRWVP